MPDRTCPKCNRPVPSYRISCKYCGKKMGRATDSLSTEEQLTNQTNTYPVALIVALAEKATGISHPDLIGIGHWGVVNRQTVAKNLGQAFLSGAVGLSAPMLVKGNDYEGNIGLIVLKDEEVSYVDLGVASLDGADLNCVSINQRYLRPFLQSDSAYKTLKATFSDLEAQYRGNMLTITGEIQATLSLALLPISNTLDDKTASAEEIAHRINGMSDLATPADLLNNLLVKGPTPPDSDLSKMASNPAYTKELFEKIQILSRRKQTTLMDQLMTLSKDFKLKVLEFLQSKSEGYDRKPYKSAAALPLGLIGICYAIYSFTWIIEHEDDLQRGSFQSSGLFEIFLGMFSIIFFVGALAGFSDHNTKKWYRRQLERLGM